MRLIDADNIENNAIEYQERHSKDPLTRGEYKLIENFLYECPTVDAVPVIHARWEIDYSWLGHCRCSNCHGTSIEAEWLNRYMWPYCPNCGAKMDGGEKDETDGRG